MGKKNNDTDIFERLIMYVVTAGILIVLVLIIALVLLPFVIGILFLVNLIRYLAQDRRFKKNYFWLTDSERQDFKTVYWKLCQSYQEKSNVAYEMRTHGVWRNQDGQISIRKNVGKSLRHRENVSNASINELTPIFEELQHLPYRRWKKARKHYTNMLGFGFIAILFLIAYLSANESGNLETAAVTEPVAESVIAEPENTIVTDDLPETQGYSEDANEANDVDIDEIISGLPGGLLGFILLLVVSFFVPWIAGFIGFSIKNPKPPVVAFDNVDSYIMEKTAKRQKRQEEIKRKKEQKRLAKEQRIKEESCNAENMICEVSNSDAGNTEKPNSETHDESLPVSQSNEPHMKSKEENMFISWADSLKKSGHDIIGNWENWENSGQWKNIGVILPVLDIRVRVIIEHDMKSKKTYFGIAKLDENDTVSQELLNNGKFRQVVSDSGLMVKQNNWWYCLKFAPLDNIFEQYSRLVESMRGI